MNDGKDLHEEITFKCKLHLKQAQAFCTEEGCQEKILCYICIRTNHPHSEDKYQNIIDIFKMRSLSDNSNKIVVDKALEQFKTGNQSIEKHYNQLKIEFAWYGQLSKEVETKFKNLNFNLEPANAIKAELKSLIPKGSGSSVIIDGPELNQLINRFLKLGSAGQTNSADRDKALNLQKKAEQLLVDFTKKFEQLTSEFSTVAGVKRLKEGPLNQKKNDVLNQSPPVQYAPKATFKLTEENNDSLKGKDKTAEVSKNDINLKKVSSFELKTNQKSTSKMDIEKPLQVNDSLKGKDKPAEVSKNDANPKKVSNLELKPDQKTASKMDIEKPLQVNNTTVPKKNGAERLENRMEILSATRTQSSDKSPAVKASNTALINDKGSEITGNEIDPREELKIRIKLSLLSGKKEKLDHIEHMIEIAEGISTLDPETKAKVLLEKATIEEYKKTLIKGSDITIVTKEALKFLNDLNSKTKKRSLRDYQQTIQKQKAIFLKEYNDWLEEAKALELLTRMKESSVNFSEQEPELRDRLKNFTSSWKEIEPKIDSNRNEKLQFNDIETSLQKLWTLRIKAPKMEKLLNMYFACKEIKISMKYIHGRFKQLELDRCTLFKEDTKEAEVLAISQHCKEISLVNAVILKNNILEWGQKVDFGSDYIKLSKLIDDTEQTKKTVLEVIKSQKLSSNVAVISEIQVTRCMHQLFFDEMIEFRDWYLKHKKLQAQEARKVSSSTEHSYIKEGPNGLMNRAEENKKKIRTVGDIIEKSKELRAEVQKFDNTDWIQSAEEAIQILEKLEKAYAELIIKDPQILKMIQDNLIKYRQVAKKGPRQISAENSKALTGNEKNSFERKLTNISTILADFLMDRVAGKNFYEKLVAVKESLLKVYGNQEFHPLKSQPDILNSGLFQGTKNYKNSELLTLLSAVESSEASPDKTFMSWVLITTMILEAKKGPFKIFEKLLRLSENLLKSGAIQVNTPIYLNFLKNYARAKSLHCELIFVKGTFKSQNNPEASSKRKFLQMNAEYLKGLLHRIKNGRLTAKVLRQQIRQTLKQSKKHDEEFESFEERYRNGTRASPSEFNKFVKKIDSSLCISRKLDKKIEEILQKEKFLKQELKGFNSDNITPNALYQKMSNFCFQSYPEHIISSKKCEKFITGFKQYHPLFDEYQNINQLQDKATISQIMDLRQKVEEFEASLAGKKSIYKGGIHQIKKLLCRVRIFLLQSGVKGVNKDVKFSTADVMVLIRDMNNLNFERKNSFGRTDMVFMSDFKKKMENTQIEIIKATSTNELETVMKKTKQKYHGAVDFGQELESKKEELKKAVSMVQNAILPAPADTMKISKAETPKKKPITIDLDLEPVLEKEPFEILEPLVLGSAEPKQSLSAEPKQSLSAEPKLSLSSALSVLRTQVKIEGKEKPPEQKNSAVVLIIDSDDEDASKIAPFKISREESKDSLIMEFEPSLSKKVKDNSGSQILVKSPTNSNQEGFPSIIEKITQAIDKEPNIRNRRKDFLIHTKEIEKAIRQSAHKDTSQKGEGFWTDRFAQLLFKYNELRNIWALLLEAFDIDFFQSVLQVGSEELKELETRAQEEIERGKTRNLSAKQIMCRVVQHRRAAIKSSF